MNSEPIKTNEKKQQPKKELSKVRCIVTGAGMNKSRTAEIHRLVKHQRYNKYVRQKTKLMFHDEENVSQPGDEVLVYQCRPKSHRKRFTLISVVRKFTE